MITKIVIVLKTNVTYYEDEKNIYDSIVGYELII